MDRACVPEFGYATNGTDLIEVYYFTGQETPVAAYPSPYDFCAATSRHGHQRPAQVGQLLTPYNLAARSPRHYQ